MQVAAKHERKIMDKAGDFKHAIVIREDVKAFEQSKKEKRDEKEKRAKEHLGLLR